MTRWVPAPERRLNPREPTPPETVDAYRRLLAPESRRGSRLRWATGGVIGLATIGIAQWLWRSASDAGARPPATRTPAGTPPRATKD
jgi:hypothetical protein